MAESAPEAEAGACPPPPAQLSNPFDAVQKEGKNKTLKWCVWEVLKERPAGMKVAEIIEEIDAKGLYHAKLGAAKNPSGQVRKRLRRVCAPSVSCQANKAHPGVLRCLHHDLHKAGWCFGSVEKECPL
jgi:hypothetical protein